MTILSLADSCRLLAIDAKTLHRWLSLAHISVQAHPLDARLKCVTCEQVQQLAATHRRTLPELSEPPFPAAPSVPSIPSDVRAASVWSCVVSEVSTPITELTQQLGSLQIQVVTLQHQLALLTEQLQKEQQWRISVTKTFEDNSLESSLEKSAESSLEKPTESSLEKPTESSLEKPTESSLEKSAESSLEKSAESSLEKESVPTSIDRRKHPRVLPLVEYGAQGNSVVISPEQGLLELAPDSPEWFAWLSTLPSFRFVGLHGRFTAFRGYQCSPHTSWWAHRQIRNHSHKRRLGLTDSVTIASLELAASSLQALV